MKFTQTLLRFPLGFLAGLALLIGCQSTSGPDPVSSTAMTAKGSVEFTDTLRLPDSGVWRTNNTTRSDTGRGKVVCKIKSTGKYDCSQSFALKNVLGSDHLLQDVYALGVHFATLGYSQAGSQIQLTYERSDLEYFPFESNLIHDFNELYQKIHTADQKPTPADLIAYYVELLLDADVSVKDSTLPKGMVADTVKKILVQVAAQNGVTAKALAAQALLGLTSESMIRSITDALVKAGVKIDTTKLYPPVPVRVVDSAKVVSDLTEGEGGVAVSGAFAWETTGVVWKTDYKVVTAAGVVDDSIDFDFGKKQFDPTSGSWVLTNNLTLKAKMGATIGTDTLIMMVIGGSDTATSKTAFNVLRGDTIRPKLSITQPAEDTEVVNTTEKITVVANASDAKGVAEVKIGNTILATSPYSAEVDLAVGYNFIVVRAKDNAGNVSIDTVVVRRATSTTSIDTALLDVVKLSDRSVSAETESDTLVWTVFNSAKAVSGMLNDKPVTVGATIRSVVSLVAGINTFVLALKDASGKTVYDTVIVARAIDATGPSIIWIVPTANTSVEAGTSSYAVKVKVTDPSGVDTVHIAGAVAKKEANDVYSHTVNLPKLDGYPIVVLVRAKDTKGNVKLDSSVTITRKVPDSTDKPVITLVKPTSAKGNKLSFEESTLHVEAEITDVLLAVDASSVKFNSIAAKATGSVYAADVPVPATGTTFTITIKASNVNGTTSTLEIEVLRASDTVKPVIAPDSATKTKSVEYATRTIDLSWTASDNDDVDSIYFNGAPQTLATTFKKSVTLGLGANTFTFTAKDRAGNRDSSVVTITRTADATGPDLTVTAPLEGEVVAYGTKSVSVSATATDGGSGLASIAIGTKTCTSSPCTGDVTVGVDGKITVTAKDSVGNPSSKTVTVKFDTDKTAPVITRSIGTKDIVVLGTLTSLSVSWTVTDNELKSVKINGSAATGASNVYSAMVPLTDNSQWIVIEAKDGANTSMDSIKVQRVSPPTLTAGGNFVGAKSVSITAPVGVIEYSTDGEKTWKAYATALNLMDTTILVSRASLEGVAAKTAVVTYNISQDVTLASVKVGGVSGTISGTTITVPALTTITSTVSVTATAADADATVAIGGGASPRTVSLDYDSAVVQILVTNRTSSRLYTMRIKLAAAGTISDNRDSRTYNVVKIGTQWWMAENLKFTDGGTIGGCSNGDPANCVTYGRNYTWTEATTGSGVCPTGWHLPSSAEWRSVINFAGGDTVGASTLLAKSVGGTDNYGFGAVLGGMGTTEDGIGGSVNWFGAYWASYLGSDEVGDTDAVSFRFWMTDMATPITQQAQFKANFLSVRCVKNF